MDLEKLAFCTREEFEQKLNKLCSEPTDDMNPGEYDAALEEREKIRRSVMRLRIEALLDGKLTVDQVIDQEHSENQDEDYFDDIRRGVLEKTLEKLKEGNDRNKIIAVTFKALELL